MSHYTGGNMTYIFILGIILVAIPLLIIEGFAHVIFFSFMRDDNDTRSLLNLALGIMAFGLLLILIHYGMKAVN